MRDPQFQAGVRHGHTLAIRQCVCTVTKHLSPSIALRMDALMSKLKIPTITPKKRGRPRKSSPNSGHAEDSGGTASEGDDEQPAPKKRGRPKKKTGDVLQSDKSPVYVADEDIERQLNRPRRSVSVPQYAEVPIDSDKGDDDDGGNAVTAVTAVKKPAGKRGRGRPRKVAVVDSAEESDFEASNMLVIKNAASRGRNCVLEPESVSNIATPEADGTSRKCFDLRRALRVAQSGEIPDGLDFGTVTAVDIAEQPARKGGNPHFSKNTFIQRGSETIVVSDLEVTATTTTIVTDHHLFKPVQHHAATLVVSDLEPAATAAGIVNPHARKRGRPRKEHAYTFVEPAVPGASFISAGSMRAKINVPQKQLPRASLSGPYMGQGKYEPSTKYPCGFGPDGTIVSDLE